MRAITIDAYGTQPWLQALPKPQPGEGEILYEQICPNSG